MRYIITINGSYVYKYETNEAIYRAEIEKNRAIEVLSYLDTLPTAYDCYTNNETFIESAMLENIEDYLSDEHFLTLIRGSRKPVEDIKSYLYERRYGIQKINAYTRNADLKKFIMNELSRRFDDLIVTSSVKENIEINNIGANKGIAVRKIAEDMGITMDRVMTFGDNYNDIPMLTAAGWGVCMANGVDEAKQVSKIIAPSNDADGVASIIEEVLRQQ